MGKEELIKEIAKYQYEDEDKVVELCHQLTELANQDEDTDTLGVALFYEGDANYYKDEDKAYKFLQSSLNYLNEDKDAYLAAKANNTLGIIASHKEDYTTAINYHLACLDICEKNSIDYVAGLTAANLGFLFQSIAIYDKAACYYQKATEHFAKEKENEFSEIYIATIMTNIFCCNYYLKDKVQMEEWIEKIRENSKLIEPKYAVELIEAAFCDILGEEEKMLSYIDKAIELAKDETEVADYLDMYQFFTRFLYDKNLMPQLGVIIDLIDKYLPKEGYPRIQIEFMKHKMAYYKSRNDGEGYVLAAENYVRLYESITSTYYKTIGESLELQLFIKRLMDQEKYYKKEAGTDNLTKLLNRNGMDKFASPIIYEAIAQEQEVTTLILDVDYFKQYNDHYGHVHGDECLKAVAGAIVGSLRHDIQACRYGGDEFVVICGNMNKETAKSSLEKLISNIRDLKIESANSPISDYVTVSVGVHVAVPKMGQSWMDLVELADKALYEVKERGRNGFVIL